MSQIESIVNTVIDHPKSKEVEQPMSVKDAIAHLEQAQRCVAPVLENASKLSNEDFRCRVASLMDELNACAEELVDLQLIEEFMKGE